MFTHRGAAGVLAALLAAGGLSACGGNGDDQDSAGNTSPPGVVTDQPTTPTPTATTAAPAEDVELLEFEIAGGQASPSLERVAVDRGSTVRIVVTSDQPDELHVHGYDLEAAIGPSEDGVIEFVADQTGLFELETHETGLVLAQLQVQ